MKIFKDALQRDWTVSINVLAVKRIKAKLDIDLLDSTKGELLLSLADDPVSLCDMLWILCEEEATKRGIGDEDFGRSLAGDAIDRATTAFLEELVDFFPSGKRRILETMLACLKTFQALASNRALAMMDSPELTARMERQVEAAIQEVLKG
jgi:hypothetical protein